MSGEASATTPAFGPRHWRMVSGLVMFTYVTLHLVNHMLGIVSIAWAEAGLRLSIALWHSPIGTLALYGAFAVHFALALWTLNRRRHWRLPAVEWVRLWAGFSLPLLLIGHAVNTRVAASFYDFHPDYERVIASLVNGGTQGLQLALLAPGWLHGCLGLWIALRRHALMQRARTGLVIIMIAVPLLSAAGFVRMSRSVEEQSAIVAAHVREASPRAAALARWRSVLLGGYLVLVIGALASGVLMSRAVSETPETSH